MDHVGGRTMTVDIDGANYDLGAEWIGPGQDLIKDLALKSGNELLPQFHEGRKVMIFGKSFETYQSDIPDNVGIFALI